MRGWWREMGALVLPTACAGCGGGGGPLCGRCEGLVAGGRARRVRPWPPPAGLPPVYAVGEYADETRAVLLAHKERGVLALAGVLGRALAVSVRAVLERARAAGGAAPDVVTLVPVPSSRAAVARRGHDPVRRAARAAAARLRREGEPVRVRAVLRQRRVVADQSGLGAAERVANLAGALVAVGRGVAGGAPVVLVDDLVTSGASLAEAARAVAAGGGAVLGAAVVAARPPGPAEAEPGGRGAG